MKILVKGKLDNLKETKFECHRCGCVFVADDTEYSVTGECLGIYTLQHDCPCCGLRLSVYDDRTRYF